MGGSGSACIILVYIRIFVCYAIDIIKELIVIIVLGGVKIYIKNVSIVISCKIILLNNTLNG